MIKRYALINDEGKVDNIVVLDKRGENAALMSGWAKRGLKLRELDDDERCMPGSVWNKEEQCFDDPESADDQ